MQAGAGACRLTCRSAAWLHSIAILTLLPRQNATSAPGSTACICRAGFHNTSARVMASSPSAGNETYHSYDHAGSLCLPCPPGSYKEANGSAPCRQCLSGKYSRRAAQTSPSACLICPLHSYAGPGSSACTACPEGSEAWLPRFDAAEAERLWQAANNISIFHNRSDCTVPNP